MLRGRRCRNGLRVVVVGDGGDGGVGGSSGGGGVGVDVVLTFIPRHNLVLGRKTGFNNC